jgi:hypothetical protein
VRVERRRGEKGKDSEGEEGAGREAAGGEEGREGERETGREGGGGPRELEWGREAEQQRQEGVERRSRIRKLVKERVISRVGLEGKGAAKDKL